MKSELLFFAAIAGVLARASGQPTSSDDHFQSGGKEIRVETFGGQSNDRTPSIIFLHGSTGIEFANRFIAQLAQSMAAQGLVVHLVHYFDRTGTQLADDRTIKQHSAEWLAAVDDAVQWARRKRPRAPLGLFGYSLGGYLAAAEGVASEKIGAMVVLAGGLDEESARRLKFAPPALLLHGSADNRVPVSESRRLERALQSAGRPPEFHLYPGEGHILQLGAYADVVARSVKFFHEQLARRAP